MSLYLPRGVTAKIGDANIDSRDLPTIGAMPAPEAPNPHRVGIGWFEGPNGPIVQVGWLYDTIKLTMGVEDAFNFGDQIKRCAQEALLAHAEQQGVTADDGDQGRHLRAVDPLGAAPDLPG